jgi:hypothetical protein
MEHNSLHNLLLILCSTISQLQYSKEFANGDCQLLGEDSSVTKQNFRGDVKHFWKVQKKKYPYDYLSSEEIVA